MTNAPLHLRITALVLLGLAAGCSSDGDTLDPVRDTLPVIGSFSVSPSPVDFGDGATLSWKTTGARQIVISAGTDVLLDTTSEPNGLLEVSPQRTTTYTLRAINLKGETTSDAVIEVRPAILELTTAAGNGPAVIGKPLAVNWKTGGALEVTLANDEDFSTTVSGAQAIQGWVEAPVSESGTFTLTARSGEFEVSQTITVDAIDLDEPVIATFESDLAYVTGGNDEAVEVSWSVAGATELRLFVNLEPFDLGDRSLESDSATFVINETTEFVLVANNLAGEAEAKFQVVAEPIPTIVSLQAFPPRLPAGAGTSLEWVTQGAATVELEADGLLLDLGELETSGSAEIASVAADTTFLLRAFNHAGGTSESTVVVAIGAPEIVAFGSPRPNVAQGVPVDLEWEVLGGSQLTVLDPNLEPIDGCLTVDLKQIRDGGCQITSPDELGSYVYTLSVRDSSSQEVRETFTLRVVDGPTIESFTASTNRVAPGESVTLSWETRTDAHGVAPTLALVDDQGGSYSLAGLDPFLDSVDVTPGGTGPHLFTLTASTPGTVASDATLTVVVETLATIALIAPEEYDPATAESMELGWTQTDAVSLTIWALDEEHNPIEPPIFSEENPAATGSISVDPEATITYLAVVENSRGTPSEAETTVRVLGPEIITFLASPSDVLHDGVSNLSWTTANVTSVSLDPPASYSIRESTAPYLAVSERPTSSHLDHAGNTCNGTGTPACPLLVFPAGFTFTYNGFTYDRVNVFQSGFISFDLNRDNSTTPTSATQQPLPVNPGGSGTNTSGWTEVIAPYWSNLGMVAGSGIYYELITDDPRGRYLVIEWHEMEQRAARFNCTENIGINLILWEDGGFDFRYKMGVTDTSTLGTALCNGSAASIGFQHDVGEAGHQISLNKAQVNGIGGKAWSMFPASMGPDGSVSVLVPESQIFTLTAVGARGRTVTREVTVNTHLPPSFVSLTTNPPFTTDRSGNVVLQPANVDTLASIEWRTINVTTVVVEDDSGNVVCPTATNAAPNGACAVTRGTPGIYDYFVTGIDMMGNTVTRMVSFDFRDMFRIDSLAVTPDEIPANALSPVTVSWEGVGAASFKLFANNVELGDLGVSDPNHGSVTLNPNQATTYKLELTSADGRKESKEVALSVRTFETGTITSPVTVTDGTQPVTIEWETPLLLEGRPMITLEPETFPMVEVMDSPFNDISTTGTEIESVKRPGNAAAANNVEVKFPPDFTFPFFDWIATGVYPATSGFISMRSGSASFVPQPMNYWAGNFEHVHIAPFYESMRSADVGTIYHQFIEHPTNPELDHQVIQWQKMQIDINSDGSDDLTFQAALYRDGSIEFRYKTMSSTRFPERAGGTTAVAGFHEPMPDLSKYTPPWRAFELFFKPANPINLAGRTFRYQARKATDSLTITPEKTTEYKVCTSFQGFRECKSVVVVVPEPGDLLITELNLNPANGLEEQWIEILNTTPYSIDIRGMTLSSDSSTTVISGSTPIVAAPGQYLILAASDIAGLNPDYVYGTSFTMGTAVDTLRISFNSRPVAELVWDTDWNIPAGKTLSLDSRWMRPHVHSNSDPVRWCEMSSSGTRRSAVTCSSTHYNVNPFSSQAFIDISRTGTEIGALRGGNPGPDRTFAIPGGLGFTIPFFGVPVNSIWVSSNGFAGVTGSQDSRPMNEPIPTFASSAPGIIAPLWSPFDNSGRVYYERLTIGGRQVLVIQWDKVVRHIGNTQNNAPGNTTFQLQIWQNGDIVFSYGDMSAIYTPVAGDTDPKQEHFGGVGTVGIEAIGGQEGFQYLYKEPILRKGQTIAYINKSGTGGRR